MTRLSPAPLKLRVTAPLWRVDIGGVLTTFDVEIEFLATQTAAGYPASINNLDGGEPAQAAEVDYAVTGFVFPGGVEPGDAPGPITHAEQATLREWFEENTERADEAFEDETRDWQAPE